MLLFNLPIAWAAAMFCTTWQPSRHGKSRTSSLAPFSPVMLLGVPSAWKSNGGWWCNWAVGKRSFGRDGTGTTFSLKPSSVLGYLDVHVPLVIISTCHPHSARTVTVTIVISFQASNRQGTCLPSPVSRPILISPETRIPYSSTTPVRLPKPPYQMPSCHQCNHPGIHEVSQPLVSILSQIIQTEQPAYYFPHGVPLALTRAERPGLAIRPSNPCHSHSFTRLQDTAFKEEPCPELSGVKRNEHEIKHTRLTDQVRARNVTWRGPFIHWLVLGRRPVSFGSKLGCQE